MKLDSQEREELEAFLTLCERPLRCPERPLGHEDVKRSKDGLRILKPLRYASQCERSDAHLGCPHLLADLLFTRQTTVFKKALLTLLKYGGDRATRIKSALKDVQPESQDLDDRMEVARIGQTTLINLHSSDIPSIATAAKNAVPIAREFASHNRENIEPIRLELVALLQEVLSEENVIKTA